MVKIRLTRMGAKKRPYYRVVAVDSRTRRDGRPLEFLGTYDPVSRGKTLDLDVPRVDAWLAKGAQLSATAAALLRRARATAAAAPAATPVAAGETEAS